MTLPSEVWCALAAWSWLREQKQGLSLIHISYCDITYSIVRHGDVNAIAPFYRLNASEEIGS